jgi:hypothetical protein
MMGEVLSSLHDVLHVWVVSIFIFDRNFQTEVEAGPATAR